MWTLGRFLPLVVGHLVPEDNEMWLNYLRLLNIMNILFAPMVTKEDCVFLESLISDHHHTLKFLFPDLRITPKLHYLIHTPRLMLQYVSSYLAHNHIYYMYVFVGLVHYLSIGQCAMKLNIITSSIYLV